MAGSHSMAPEAGEEQYAMLVAIDNGGTTTRIGLLEASSSSKVEIVDRFATEESYEAQIAKIISAVSTLNQRRLRGIGISFGAQIARDGKSILDGANLRDYERKPIVQRLRSRFGCEVRLAHDAVCGLLAEDTFGGLSRFDQCAYLTVSTGTGAAVRVRKGKASLVFSIEMGHQILAGNTLKCLCGQTGCLETMTGGKQIALRYGKECSEITDQAFWRDFTESLAVGIVNLSWLARVEAIAVSGGIALNSTYLRAHLQERVDALRVGDECLLVWSNLGDNSPLVGASLLVNTPESMIAH